MSNMSKCWCTCMMCGASMINAEWKELLECPVCKGRYCDQCIDENGLCGKCNDFIHEDDE